ncbi:ATP12 family chaperone protein [Sphingomicrobium lutaoense]|uniref:Chaperone required for assembly of F1-ATPase n=1 Tax=Sphingomicrobium lutaoense TaxID=515949 RepID=A0A839YS30_9SPHN|nr:ATP12 family protein [Sphingomicrobium lutaoense]MBB3763091.1 chaperone required for assembly of F1-ATPase [Sphingomicrobium lutaoense]
MKRFWKEASREPQDDGHVILLDGRKVMTPAKRELVVPTGTLADAIVEEWQSAGEKVDPAAMPMTGLANAAIDRVMPDRQAFAAGLSRFAESEMCCYRADQPDALVERQAASWDRLIDWAQARYDIHFTVTSGVMHVAQPETTLDRLASAVGSEDAFHLAGLSPLVTAGQSLLVALAVRHGELSPEEGWKASQIEEDWQIEHWGEDEEARKASEARRRDFLNGARFLSLL